LWATCSNLITTKCYCQPERPEWHQTNTWMYQNRCRVSVWHGLGNNDTSWWVASVLCDDISGDDGDDIKIKTRIEVVMWNSRWPNYHSTDTLCMVFALAPCILSVSLGENEKVTYQLPPNTVCNLPRINSRYFISSGCLWL